MGLIGRPRDYCTERVATTAERQRRFAQKRREELQALREKLRRKVYHESNNPNAATPWYVYDVYNDEFCFTLDVCANANNFKHPCYFSPEMDGLKQDWGTNICWMNPPYSRDRSVLYAWMKKAYESSLAGATVVALVPARTDTGWWHDWVEGKASETRRRKGRITFVGYANSAGFPSIAVIYRPPTH